MTQPTFPLLDFVIAADAYYNQARANIAAVVEKAIAGKLQEMGWIPPMPADTIPPMPHEVPAVTQESPPVPDEVPIPESPQGPQGDPIELGKALASKRKGKIKPLSPEQEARIAALPAPELLADAVDTVPAEQIVKSRTRYVEDDPETRMGGGL